MKPEEKKKWFELQHELYRFKPLYPGQMPIGIGITDIGPEAPKTHTVAVGVYDNPIAEVQPGVPAVCGEWQSAIHNPQSTITTGRRAALASWLASPDNPLTARVIVNRLWHYHFGRGIIGTPSDFGLKGDRPTHPQLLDWLASELITSGWSLKHIHRLIMNSSTYQQASADNDANAKVDP